MLPQRNTGRVLPFGRDCHIACLGLSWPPRVVESQLVHTRAAIPAGRDDGGPVKRAIPRVLIFSLAILLVTFLFASPSRINVITQTSPDEPKAKDDVKKDTRSDHNVGVNDQQYLSAADRNSDSTSGVFFIESWTPLWLE